VIFGAPLLLPLVVAHRDANALLEAMHPTAAELIDSVSNGELERPLYLTARFPS
jgi:hypothetical protein